MKKRTFRDILLESTEKKVYIDPDSGQYVSVTFHGGTERLECQWWDSWKDDSFTRFVGKGLRRLNSLYKEKIKDPHYPIDFRHTEVIGIVNKDRTRGLVCSLRDTGGKSLHHLV